MAARKGAVNRFTPVRGWVTEGNLANFGQDVALDVENMDIEKTGLTQRRMGLFAETSTESFLPTFDANARARGLLSIKEWREFWADRDVNMLIIHAGYSVHVVTDTDPLVNANILLTIDLTEAGIKLDGVIDSPIHISVGVGFAILTNPRIEPVLIKLEDVDDDGVPTLSYEPLNLMIRTRELLTPFTAGQNYGDVLTAEEEWNLYNSGWATIVRAAKDKEGSGTVYVNPVAYYKEKRGVYPTHSTLYNSMKQQSAKEIVALNAFSPWADEKINFGTTTPPLGRYIHSAYNFDSRAVLEAGLGGSTQPTSDGVTTDSDIIYGEGLGTFIRSVFEANAADIAGKTEEELTSDEFLNALAETSSPFGQAADSLIGNSISINNVGTVNNLKLISEGTVTWSVKDRPRCSGYHNGHVYFADRDHNGKTRILVSQLVNSLDNISKCYQDADPTAEEINDLIATDGFTMYPVGMGAPLTMVEFNKRLLLLCTNGVWAIRGTSGGGATATDFTLDKVASVDFTAPQSVVDVGTAVLFWSERGIIAIGVNDFGDLTSNNLTENTIDEYYDSLDRDIIKNVKGTFINDENRVYWTVPAKQNAQGEYKIDAELVLVLNLDTGGFYKHTVSGGPVLHAPFRRLNNTRNEIDDIVYETDGTIVTDTLGDPVLVAKTVTVTGVDGLAYFSSYADPVEPFYSFVAVHYDYGLADWNNVPNVGRTDYLSFVDFAYEYPEVMIGQIAVPYIHSYYLTGIRVNTAAFGDTWNITTETAHVSFHRVEQQLTPDAAFVSFHQPEEMITPNVQLVSFHKDDLERTETGFLVNGDAETGTAFGWVAGALVVVNNPAFAHSGTYYFSGDNLGLGAYQEIDLVGLGIIGATEAADKTIEAKLRWWARGSGSDVGTMYLEYYNSVGVLIDTMDSPMFEGHFGGGWCRYARNEVLPDGTAKIRVHMAGLILSSPNCDYYIDDIELLLEVHNA